jgi:tRNA-dihydrouridine synthase
MKVKNTKKRNFWQELAIHQRPFFCLAPMEDVTDIAFREMFVRYSKCRTTSFFSMLTRFFTRVKPFVLFTEFTPSDGLAFGDEKAQERLRAKLSYFKGQRPIVAQIYNSNEERMEHAARLVQEFGFDGVDINMGCPVNAVVKQISGAALIKHPELAVKLMRAVRRGAPNIPLSVKTRIGYSSKDDMHDWMTTILTEKPDALTIHLRTRSQMSKVPAQWELLPSIIKLRDELSPDTVIIGNGDVMSMEHGMELVQTYGGEGVMVGRGAYGKPDFFLRDISQRCTRKECKIQMLIEHIELFDTLLLQQEYKGYHVMKKHYKAYITGWSGAKELRARLMETDTPREAIGILRSAV